MKKIIAMLACLTMLLSMAACGTTEPEKTEGTTTAPTTQATENTTEATEDTTEATEDTTEATEGTTDATVGQTLLAAFKADTTGTPEEIANRVIADPSIQFMPVVMPMNVGDYLPGFNTEITGFEQCATFAPMIGTIPFMGYIFTVAEGADVEAFKTTLTENANLRWNICTAAEELIVESEGNTVFFLMCPASFEQPEVEGDEGLVEDFPIDDMPAAEGEGIVLG